jgi:hypothetical protein
MKTFSSRIAVLLSLMLLGACSAPRASVINTDIPAADEAVSSSSGGPYLEFEDEEGEEDGVEFDLQASSSSATL